MITYEVAMGMSLIPVLLMSGNVSLAGDRLPAADRRADPWYVLPLFLSFFIFLVSGFAETNRLPFDLPEAESELIAGYHTEYSAMKFSFFFIAEYANVVTVCAMVTTLFFGGWDIPFTDWDRSGGVLQTLATWLVFFLKVMFWVFFVMWIRWTLPRFRYDQLMALGWKVLMPLALAYIMVICAAIYVIEHVAGITGPVPVSLALLGAQRGGRRSWCSGCWTAGSSSGAPAGSRPPARSPSARTVRLMAIGVKVMKRPERAGQLRPGHAQGHGAHLQAHVRAEGDDAVPGAEEHRPGHGRISPALARHPPHADRRAGPLQVRGLRALSPDLPGQLHQAGARRGRGGEPLPAHLRDRRVPLRLLRLLPGGLPRGGDPRGRPLRERRVQPGPLRVRPGAALSPRPTRCPRSGTPPTRGASR